ncbi:MAG: DUF4234 domain-containing protein [Actinomycetia bacterium]|nr:DUF4234 domain-containing protein [Actinomycetes bacterium]
MHTTRSLAASSHPPVPGAQRHPWKEWGLAIITLGIYAAVNHYRINRELRDFGVDVDPLKALIALVPGGLLIIPPFVTIYRTSQRIAVAQETTGLTPTIRPELSAIGSVIALVHIVYQQSQLNRAWQADASGEQT